MITLTRTKKEGRGMIRSLCRAYINGSKNDRRVNKPWDWFYPPFK